MNLEKVGLPFLIYSNTITALTTFVMKQYYYTSEGITILPKKSDVVLDCGGAWGDTALQFASSIGNEGKVFSFEFIESNIEIFEKNISLNKLFQNQIQLIKGPVWEKSNENLYYNDHGPASNVSFHPIDESYNRIDTISIDDFVKSSGFNKIDFIKMDIEGAELNALKGAEETIIKFKPNLAIAVYHRLEDFINIPKYLNNLNVGYEFYLGHYTIHEEETILFATINQKM